MTDIERLRHSAAHVLATAILRIWPEAQFAAGPPVENGFYYDLEMPHRISQEDFENWLNGQAFQQGHAGHAKGGPVSTGSELWSFDVVQHEEAPVS